MATITLSPPTEEEIERNLSGQRPLTSMDIGKGTPTGTTPEMEGFTAEAEKLSVSRQDTTRADAGLAGDFVKGFNEIILALPDAAINAIAEIGEMVLKAIF